MKNKLNFFINVFIVVATILQSCIERKYAKFEITDVSKPIMFIDSITGEKRWPVKYHANVDLIINGELDSSATVSFNATDKRYNSMKTIELNKGIVNTNYKIDYYGGDTIWIKFNPIGSTKGHLTIKTRVN